MRGKSHFRFIVRTLIALSSENNCGWSDDEFEAAAKSLEQIIQLNRRAEVSNDTAARLLGCSTRTLRRKVEEGKIPAPHRNGDSSGLKHFVDDIMQQEDF